MPKIPGGPPKSRAAPMMPVSEPREPTQVDEIPFDELGGPEARTDGMTRPKHGAKVKGGPLTPPPAPKSIVGPPDVAPAPETCVCPKCNGTGRVVKTAPVVVAEEGERPLKTEPTNVQLWILRILSKAKGALSITILERKIGCKYTAVWNAIGITDPVKRAAYERSKNGRWQATLMTLGYVRYVINDLDGKKEPAYEITPEGRAAYEDRGGDSIILPVYGEKD
jgi:hypothetical protein